LLIQLIADFQLPIVNLEAMKQTAFKHSQSELIVDFEGVIEEKAEVVSPPFQSAIGNRKSTIP